MNDKLEENSVWCGTFQLIWNDLKNGLAKMDIEFIPQLEVVENLNKEEFKSNMISEDYYYKKCGKMTSNLKEEIEKSIEVKFNETSDILNDFEWSSEESNKYFLYAMLKKEFEFKYDFDELEDGSFANKYDNIKYFGINSDTDKQVREQVEVLYYNSEDDFAVILKTKQSDEVILCKADGYSTFNEAYNIINDSTLSYNGSKDLFERDELRVPNIAFKERAEFKELENKVFKSENNGDFVIDNAVQTIQFELDKHGGKVKSEAEMEITQSAYALQEEQEVRYFNFDNTFTMFLREEGKEKPYFATTISDITKFQ